VLRERANVRYGMTSKEADEERVDAGKEEDPELASTTLGAKNAEAPISPSTTSGRAEHENEDPGHLVSPGMVVGKGRAMGKPPIPLVRQSTKGSLPPVDQVLKRTVSLGGASIHGGG
jgi:hypothetical protein